MSHSAGEETNLKQQPRPQPGDVLHQRRGPPRGPAAMVVGGLVFVATIGYFALVAKSKPNSAGEPSEVAKLK